MNWDSWESATCTCRRYQKEYVCKHVIGIAVRNKKFDLRPEARGILLGQKRKRGRPEKAKKALIVQ